MWVEISMSKKIIKSIGIFLTLIISLSCFLITPQQKHNFTIIGNDNSYAFKVASKNNISVKKVYDSNKDEYQQEAQVLKYTEKNGYYEVNGYDGISNMIIIPDTYNNKKIVSINKDFLKNNSSVKKIVIGKNIENFDTDAFSNYTIECYENAFCKTLNNNNIKNIDFSEYNSLISNLSFTFPYEYNINNNTISLEKYLGNESSVIIPFKYNGHDITKINFDIDKTSINEIYMSDNIKYINIVKLNNIKYSIIFNVISLIIFIILISIQSSKTLKENVYNTNNYILAMIVLLINLLLALMFMINCINLKLYIIIFGIVFLLQIILYIIFSNVKRVNIKYDQKIKKIDTYKNELLIILKDKNNNYLENLIGNIKYMDPVSNKYVNEIEQEIKERVYNITNDTSKEEIQAIITLINKRNLILKNNK